MKFSLSVLELGVHMFRVLCYFCYLLCIRASNRYETNKRRRRRRRRRRGRRRPLVISLFSRLFSYLNALWRFRSLCTNQVFTCLECCVTFVTFYASARVTKQTKRRRRRRRRGRRRMLVISLFSSLLSSLNALWKFSLSVTRIRCFSRVFKSCTDVLVTFVTFYATRE